MSKIRFKKSRTLINVDDLVYSEMGYTTIIIDKDPNKLSAIESLILESKYSSNDDILV